LPTRCCRYCRDSFQPAKTHPEQTVCSRPECQRQRRCDYRRAKLAADPDYAERCRQSARQWRKQHADYWPQYRQANPAAVERNREQQQARDRKRHLQQLANNTLARDLKPCPAKVWLVGPNLDQLANNTLAGAQLWILEALPRRSAAAVPLANNTALDC
jgi:hypothetical protein